MLSSRSLHSLAGIAAALLPALLLAGCVTASGCNAACNPDERFPPGLVRFAERHVEGAVGGRDGFAIRYRDGRLHDNAEAVTYLGELARPADIVVNANRGTLTGRLIPGYFTHSAAYLGTEAQLRDLGAWQHPAIRPLHDDIRGGKVVIEATSRGVHLSALADLLDADRVLLARPGGDAGLSRSARRQAVVSLAGRIGTPFDFHFDVTTPGELFCVELLQRSIPSLDLPVETLYGRPTIKPVALAEALFRRDGGLSFVAYLKGSRMGFQGVSRGDLRAELAEARDKDMERAGCGGTTDTAKAVASRR